MSVPTTSWSELTPAGGDQINAGDNRIREMKTQIREVIDVDHNFPSSGSSATTGFHNQVTLIEAADIGSGASGLPILGAQTISGKPELVYTDEDDNDIQLTSGGKLHAAVDGLSAGLKQAIFNYMYPVGKVITLGVSTNPNTLYGFGTWTAIAGKVIVGINASDSEFDTLNETGGEKTHTLTVDEMPSHTHPHNATAGGSGSTSDEKPQTGSGGFDTGATGGGLAHNNLQPYIVKYVWERTA